MAGRLRLAGAHGATALSDGWQIRVGHMVATSPADGWSNLQCLETAAAALRRTGEWSLDESPHDFDDMAVWYRLQFDVPSEDVRDWVLRLDGVATLSEVHLNGRLLLSSESMYIAHELELATTLKPLANELLIKCYALSDSLEQRRPRPRWRTPMVRHQQLRWIRTTLLGRTPGWSPPAAPVGLWRDVRLHKRSPLDISTLHLQTAIRGRQGVLSIAGELRSGADAQIEPAVVCRLSRAGNVLEARLQMIDGSMRFRGSIEIDDVELWWPHTHGEPALYGVSLSVQGPDGEAPVEHDIGHVGFRTISLRSDGGDFELSVNGVPIFCRGACWTPIDPVSLTNSPQELRRTMQRIRDAGMNMLRVSGCMVYETDDFLDACDEHGILLWQDFMFANMDYPERDSAWSASVETEVVQQLSRMQARPSLAVLCGNSEGEQQAAMWGAVREHWQASLLQQQLRALCTEHCPDVPYWPSSSHGGAFPFQPDTGTTSYYGVGAYLRPLEDALQSGLRFATECLAFANVPDACTLARIPAAAHPLPHHGAWKQRSPRDLGAGWDFDDVRDHYLERLFGVRATDLRAVDPARYLTLSRVTTGEVMRRTYTMWRQVGSPCRGALVWFLRDLWAGAGWGLLDDTGAPKACFHMLSRALQPVFVGISDDGLNGLHVHVSHEADKPLKATLEVKAYRQSEIVVCEGSADIELEPRGCRRLAVVALLDGFMDLSYAYRFGPVEHELVVATLKGEDGAVLGQSLHWVGGWSLQRSSDIGLQAHATTLDGGAVQVTVRARAAAIAAHFEVDTHVPADDYFHLAPGGEHTVTLTPKSGNKPFLGRVAAVNATSSVPIRMAAAPGPRTGQNAAT